MDLILTCDPRNLPKVGARKSTNKHLVLNTWQEDYLRIHYGAE